jgi:rhodanese-related sulfurtransferase
VERAFGPNIPSVEPGQVADKLADGWTLLDVRTDAEWADGRIAGSVHIPMDQLTSRMDELEDRVVCVCAVGGRSGRVVKYLNARGYQAVNLEGGILAWVDAGLPVEN